MNGLPKNLFKTFIFSTIIALAANSIYYAVIQKSNLNDYQHAVSIVAGGTLFLTVILTIMSLPMLFLFSITYWNNLLVRLLLYFSGSIAFIVTIMLMPLDPANRVFDLIAGLIFILVHWFYYLKTVKASR